MDNRSQIMGLIGPDPREGDIRMFVVVKNNASFIIGIYNKVYMRSSKIYKKLEGEWESSTRTRREIKKSRVKTSLMSEIKKLRTRYKIKDERFFIVYQGQQIDETEFLKITA